MNLAMINPLKKHLLVGVILFLFAANDVSAQKGIPVNSNYLIERGISPKVLDAAADILLQEGSLVEHLKLDITTLDRTEQFKIGIIYDPAYKYGKDILFVVEEGVFGKKEIRELKNTIAKSHQYSRLSRSYLYDESTLELIEETDNGAILQYLYQRNDLEPGLKKIRKFKGVIFIKDNELEKVVITTTKPLNGRIRDYEKTVYFARIESTGGHIVSSMTEAYTLEGANSASKYTFNFETASYRTKTGQDLSWDGQRNAPLFDPAVKTDTVIATLGGTLPLMGKPATKLGYGLPKPYGIGLVHHQQTTNLQFTDLQVGTGDQLISLQDLFDLSSSSLDQPVDTWMVRADVWLLPFLNVSGIVGRAQAQVKGDIVLDQEIRETLVGLAPFLGLDPESIPTGLPLDIDVSVNTLGLGATLGGAVGDWIFTANYQFLNASVPEANTNTISHVIMPLIGYSLPLGVQLLAGAQGQFYDTNIVGFLPLENGEQFNYIVNFEPRNWNAILGAYVGIGKHLELSVNFGFGDRTSSTATLGYRF